ncbi:MAG: hypothetical protein CVU67_07535, partial [Deltaproteobacteria bacterium HGW-Deltaproteobacteria-24]
PSFTINLDKYGKEKCHGSLTIEQYHTEIEKNILADLEKYKGNSKIVQKLNYLFEKFNRLKKS